MTAAASLMAPFAMAQLAAKFRYEFLSNRALHGQIIIMNGCTLALFSCCRPMDYVEYGKCANWTQSVALLTASQLIEVAQQEQQQKSIGCCVVSAPLGEIRSASMGTG